MRLDPPERQNSTVTICMVRCDETCCPKSGSAAAEVGVAVMVSSICPSCLPYVYHRSWTVGRSIRTRACRRVNRGRREVYYLRHLTLASKSGDYRRSKQGYPCPMNIDDLLRTAIERKASDLHLKVGNYPHLRIDGLLAPMTEQPRITAEDMLGMAFSMMSARQKQKFKENSELDMAYGVAGLGRFRVNVFQQRGNVGLVRRVIPTK